MSAPAPALGPIRKLADDPTWKHARRAFLAALEPNPTCCRCGLAITGRIEVDHLTPYAVTGAHVDLAPAHPLCNASAGGHVGVARRRQRAVERPDDRTPRPITISSATAPSAPPEAAIWDVFWMSDLRSPPPDATWPRWMSAPHPNATTSLGPVFEKWVTRQGRQLRWWQRLAARRILEQDADGNLCWPEVVLTVSRQSGKSVLLRELLAWRLIHGAKEFGEPQTLLHIASNESLAIEVQRPFRNWCKSPAQAGLFKVREANGNVGVEVVEDGSRWLVKASVAVFGFSASAAVVDEAWSISPSIVDDGLTPTMLERNQAQLILTSTSHRRATGLMLDRRAACLKRLEAPDDVLLLEWSADPARADDDEQAWREASPHWTERRRKLVARQLEQAREGNSLDPDEPDPLVSFRTQYLNRWADTKVRTHRGQSLFAEGVWDSHIADGDAQERKDSPIVVAVEDTSGDRAAVVAAVETTDGRVAVWGEAFDSRDAAIQHALDLAADYEERGTVLIGASMATDPALAKATSRVESVGSKEFRTGLPLLRSVVAGGRVVHDGGADLTQQVTDVRVMEGPAGLSLVGGTRADMLRCLVWAVQASTVKLRVVPQVY